MCNIQDQLLTAVIENNLEEFKVCLSQGADISQRHGDHRKTLLHFVSSVEIAKDLLLLGVNVKTRDKNGQTPLHSALANNKELSLVRLLLSSGGDVNARDCFGQTLLNFVSSADAAKELMKLGLDVNARDRTGRTPLHWTIMYSKELTVLKELLLRGADVEAKDVNGHTPLHCAVIYSNIFSAVAKELIRYGCDINARDNWDGTPLHWAIMRGKGIDVVRNLLKHKANVNAQDSEGFTALYIAVRHHRNLGVIKELLEFGADVNIRSLELSENDEYCSPFDLAVNRSYMICAKLLIKLNTIKNHDGSCRSINLDRYVESSIYSELAAYLDKCLQEIDSMRMKKVSTNLSLYSFLIKKYEIIKPLYPNAIDIEHEIASKYPIYCDIVLPNIKLCLERAKLLNKVKSLQITTRTNTPIPNYDCIYKIAEYLSNDDLHNFIAAFGKALDQSLSSNSYK